MVAIARRPPGKTWSSGISNKVARIVTLAGQHLLVGGFKHVFYFHNIQDNPSHWLSYFSEGLKPPTRLDHQPNEDIRFNTLNVSRGCLASERPTLFGLAYVWGGIWMHIGNYYRHFWMLYWTTRSPLILRRNRRLSIAMFVDHRAERCNAPCYPESGNHMMG